MMPDVLKAMEFAKQKHLGQARDSGLDFFKAHCMVVYELVKMRMGDSVILCASLLHDVIEDTDTTYEEIYAEFGEDVADIVLMLTKTENNVFPLLQFKDGIYDKKVHKAMIIKHADTFANISEMYSWAPKDRVDYLNKKMCWWVDPSDIQKLKEN